jgi:hypothetical protein
MSRVQQLIENDAEVDRLRAKAYAVEGHASELRRQAMCLELRGDILIRVLNDDELTEYEAYLEDK